MPVVDVPGNGTDLKSSGFIVEVREIANDRVAPPFISSGHSGRGFFHQHSQGVPWLGEKDRHGFPDFPVEKHGIELANEKAYLVPCRLETFVDHDGGTFQTRMKERAPVTAMDW